MIEVLQHFKKARLPLDVAPPLSHNLRFTLAYRPQHHREVLPQAQNLEHLSTFTRSPATVLLLFELYDFSKGPLDKLLVLIEEFLLQTNL